jgi:acyl-CoA hydrolase
MSKDLNGAHKLFGGTILAWMDEQAYIDVLSLLKSQNVVTKSICDVEFISGAEVGDIIEINTEIINIGRTSISLKVFVSNKTKGTLIAKANEITMVNVDENNKPLPHQATLKSCRKNIALDLK